MVGSRTFGDWHTDSCAKETSGMAYQFASYQKQGRIGVVTINRPERMNALHPPANLELHEIWNEFERDPDVWVGILTGAGDKAFSAGNDLRYTAEHGRDMLRFGESGFGGLANRTTCWKPIIAAVNGYALGGGFEMALMADIAVVARDAVLGMPATRFLGPALGSLHLFFHRLGPVLARRLLLTGDTIPAGDVEHLGVFTEVTDDDAVAGRAEWWARKAARMPADGIVIAKEAFRLVEQLQAYQGEEVISYLVHAYGTNLQFGPDDFNFVKTRARHGVREAFAQRDAHFDVPEP
jgi:enoyl-CoA hydratase